MLLNNISAHYILSFFLGLKYLYVSPAKVESKQLFSAAGLICDTKRNRLDPKRVKCVFLTKICEKILMYIITIKKTIKSFD